MATADGVGKIYIDKAEWVSFILERFPFLKGTEFAIGPITDRLPDCLEVDYAFSEEVHPLQWSEPPAWLKETK